MSNKENTVEEVKSHSQAKREARRKEVARDKREAVMLKVVGYIIILLVAALIALGIYELVSKQSAKVQQSDDYSAGLDANGYISGVKATDKVTLPEYKGITIPYSEIEYSDESIDADIQTLLSDYEYASDDAGLKVADGDTVDIAYVGRVDGEEFEGGASDSYNLTIGSGSLIDGFESQLIGADNGSTVVINVTFPEDYGNADLAGVDAEFTVTINGIYVTPEFTDEFVAENLSDKATTVDGYRQYVRDTNEKKSTEEYVVNYLKENSEEKSYPRKYIKYLKSIQKYDDMQSYEYMNQMYQAYLGYSYYNSFEDYVGMSETEYDLSLNDTAKETCKENMAYQAIVEKEGAVADSAFYKQYLADNGYDNEYYDTQVTTAGEPFVLQQAIKAKALEIVIDSAVIQ